MVRHIVKSAIFWKNVQSARKPTKTQKSVHYHIQKTYLKASSTSDHSAGDGKPPFQTLKTCHILLQNCIICKFRITNPKRVFPSAADHFSYSNVQINCFCLWVIFFEVKGIYLVLSLETKENEIETYKNKAISKHISNETQMSTFCWRLT